MEELTNNISTYYLETFHNEETDEHVFYCPVSGQNTMEWEGENDNYPAELIYYDVNLIGEPTYIHPEFEDLYEEYLESKELEEEYDEFEDYLLSKLPPQQTYYRLIVEAADGAHGDYASFIYTGTFEQTDQS